MDEKQLFIEDTIKHQDKVEEHLNTIIKELTTRKENHDNSKLEDPELEGYVKFNPLLDKTKYGTPEFDKLLKEMQPITDHHYEENRHHPEHFKDGYKEMNLIDVMEMLCDWYAACQRKDGNIYEGLDINAKRFGLSDDILQIFKNTMKDIFNTKS